MPFIITLLAGFSTLIGYFFIYFKNRNNNLLILSLGFASGVMFFISLFDLIPESIYILTKSYGINSIIIVCLFILIGIIISYLLDILFKNESSYLYHIGIISMLAIIIHNIPEGIATFLTSTINFKLGITLALAIAFHNIPEGISISIPIYFSTGNKKKAFLYTFISGISEFIGAIIAFIFFKNSISDLFMGSLYSIIAGIMFYISIHELLPTSLKYKNTLLTILSFIIGVLFIYISIILLN